MALPVAIEPAWPGWIPSDVLALGDLVGPAPRLPSAGVVLVVLDEPGNRATWRRLRRLARRTWDLQVRVIVVTPEPPPARWAGRRLAVLQDLYGIAQARFGMVELPAAAIIDGEGAVVVQRQPVQSSDLLALEELARDLVGLAEPSPRGSHPARGHP